MNQLKLAEEIAREAHKGQTRRDRTPYIIHPKRVAQSLKASYYQAVAWLHDVIEDTDITAEELLKKGVAPRIVNSVKVLSRGYGENYFVFIMRVLRDEMAVKVKIADIEDNLRDSKESSLKDKYRLARYILKNEVEK